ncbi:nucleotidyltransferase domain-containing protein [Spirochaeta dissipatitropha]
MVDPSIAAKRILARNEQERISLARQRSEAQSEGRQLARNILEKYPEAMRVWGFGSTYEIWRNYHSSSDIDLAIEAGDLMTIYPMVECSRKKVDLVNLQDVPAAFAGFVRRNGTVLAENRDQLRQEES